MKLFDRYFVFIICILFSSRILFAYDSYHTGRLRQYYNGLIENYRKTQVRPDSIAMSREIEDCVSRGANPNTKFLNGSRPIHAAAEIGDKSLIEFLWLYGANIHYGRLNGLTPLEDAQARGYSEVVIQLTCLSTGEPELHAAIRLKTHKKELKRIVTKLEQESPDDLINQLDVRGLSALHVAVLTRNQKAVKLLLSHGADPLTGRFNVVLLASRIQWQKSIISWRKGTQPSIYDQILAVPLNHCLVIFLAFREKLPKDLYVFIIQMVLSCRRCF